MWHKRERHRLATDQCQEAFGAADPSPLFCQHLASLQFWLNTISLFHRPHNCVARLHCIDIINVIVITTPHCTVSESQAPLSCISSWNTWPCNNNVYKDPAPWFCVPVFLPRETVQHRYVCMCKPISLILHAGMGSFLHRLDCISNVHHRCLALGLQPLQIDFSTSVVDHLLAHVC